MSKRDELIDVINKYPDHELIFMYPNEGAYEHAYTAGHLSRIVVDEYCVDDERIWLKEIDFDEMFDHYGDHIFDELYPYEPYANDEQTKVINQRTKEFIGSQNWKKCICVYIGY